MFFRRSGGFPIDIDRISLVEGVHAIIIVVRLGYFGVVRHITRCRRRPPPPRIRYGGRGDVTRVPAAPPVVVKEVVPTILAIVPDLICSIITVVPHVLPVILPVLAGGIPPGLAIFACALQVIPALALILLKVV